MTILHHVVRVSVALVEHENDDDKRKKGMNESKIDTLSQKRLKKGIYLRRTYKCCGSTLINASRKEKKHRMR